ncbi:MAG: MATE family efflux transporter [Bacteroidales bacterium]|nr:MATE family efflux transporter [Bacteroidales bacterium]
MIKKIIPEFILKYFTEGNELSIKVKKNAVALLVLKGITLAISFIRVPIVLDYVTNTEYGIWLTLTSILSWLVIMDVGIGRGLQNKLAEALAVKDYKSAKTYVSTTYAIMTLIIGAAFVLFTIVFPFLNWGSIFNTPHELQSQMPLVVFVIFLSFAIQFVINLISIILTADQKPAIGEIVGTLASIVYLVILLILIKTTKGSLLLLTVTYYGSSILIYVFGTVYFFRGRYKAIAPSFKYIDLKHFRDLGTLGFKFFFIQISAIIMFSTDNMIITQIIGPQDVTAYNISYKYMCIPIMIFSIITRPLWSAYTNAWARKDIDWIKNTVSQLTKIWLLLIFSCVLMVFISAPVYRIWLHGRVTIPLYLTIVMGLYTIILAWNQIYVFFINGVGKIKLQLYMSFITTIINIPLSIYFAKTLNIGSTGIMIATCVCLFIGSVWVPIQYKKIINNKATGIWGK